MIESRRAPDHAQACPDPRRRGSAPLTAAVVVATRASAATTLGASAAERGGRYFGTAVAANKLGDARTTRSWTVSSTWSPPRTR